MGSAWPAAATTMVTHIPHSFGGCWHAGPSSTRSAWLAAAITIITRIPNSWGGCRHGKNQQPPSDGLLPDICYYLAEREKTYKARKMRKKTKGKGVLHISWSENDLKEGQGRASTGRAVRPQQTMPMTTGKGRKGNARKGNGSNAEFSVGKAHAPVSKGYRPWAGMGGKPPIPRDGRALPHGVRMAGRRNHDVYGNTRTAS